MVTSLAININISLAIDIPSDAAPVKPLELLPGSNLLYYVMEEYVNKGHGYAVVPFVGGWASRMLAHFNWISWIIYFSSIWKGW